jgi:hypothetical protein
LNHSNLSNPCFGMIPIQSVIRAPSVACEQQVPLSSALAGI